MGKDFLAMLALEYIKAHFDIKSLDVDAYFEKYFETYNKLSELYHNKKSQIANEALKEWLEKN